VKFAWLSTSITIDKEYTAHTSQAVMDVVRRLSPNIIIFGIEMNRSERLAQSISRYNQAAYSVFIGNSNGMTALDAAQREAEAAFR
jgi:hypothetical protein